MPVLDSLLSWGRGFNSMKSSGKDVKLFKITKKLLCTKKGLGLFPLITFLIKKTVVG